MDLHSGAPFWALRNGLINTYSPLDRSLTTDVAVIGAGITGALTAYEMARAGVAVVVLDRHDVAAGSTAATSGLLLYDTDASLEALGKSVGPIGAARAYRIGLEAIDRIDALTGELGDRCGFARRSALYVASSPPHVAGLAKEFDLRRRHGFDVEWIEAKELAGRFAVVAPAAIHSRGCGEIDCYRLTHKVLESASTAGVHVFARTGVTRLQPESPGVLIETTTGHTVRASRVVVATGYEVATRLRQRTGTLASTWVFVSHPLDDLDRQWPERCLIWETARPYAYFRTTDDGRLLAGGEDEPAPEEHRRARLAVEKTATLVARTRSLFPRLPVDVAYAWAGTIATTDDGLPFIGATPEWPGVWFALGYGGNGITFSVAAAGLLRDACLGRRHPDAALFAFDRVKRTGNRRVSPAAW